MEFVLLLLSSVITSVMLVYLFINARYFFVKPSIIFLVFFNVFLQWPAVYYIALVRIMLSTSYTEFVLMFSITPIASLLISCLFKRSSKIVFNNLQFPMRVPLTVKALLFLMISLGPIVYFSYISMYNTGLISILRGDSLIESSVIREKSMKMLPAFPRYVHSITTRVCCIFLIMVMMNDMASIAKGTLRKYGQMFKILALSIFTILFLSIDGSRSPGALAIASIMLFLTFKARIDLSKIFSMKVLVIFLIILCIPTTMEFLRSDTPDLWAALEVLVDRVFYIRFNAGLLNIKYAEIYGNWGVGALGNLASLFGAKSINVANFVSNLEYVTETNTGLANASFMMTYFSYFGLVAIPLCISLILFLDCFLWFVARYIRRDLFTYAMVGYTLCAYALVDADYTTIFITHGMVIWTALLYAISRISNGRIRIEDCPCMS